MSNIVYVFREDKELHWSDEPRMCESCGGGAIDSFEPYYWDGNTTWCQGCACSCTYDPDEYLSNLEVEKYEEIAAKFQELKDNFGRKKLITEIEKYIKELNS